MSTPVKPSVLIAHLIEEQLNTLPIALAAVSRAFAERNFAALPLQRKLHLVKTGSGGNIVAEEGQAVTPRMPQAEIECLRVLVSNALLAVGSFMQMHNTLTMRTPEIQFLSHAVEAILNANTITIAPGYMPVASFDGLVMNDTLDGKPLFSDSRGEGFMELGDAIALLQWLARYLSGEKNYVSGGDAG